MLITKADGTQEPFDEGKLRLSLTRAGARPGVVDDIVAHVARDIREGMTTTDIYRHAFDVLMQEEHPVAARYSLRRALADLGPSGFPFESFIAELFRAKGYAVWLDEMLAGKCVEHEVDIVAANEKEYIGIEAKFHNDYGYKTDVKVALYVKSRYDDLKATHFGGRQGTHQTPHFWLVTNTKFTENAIRYALCSGIRLMGWGFPEDYNLQDMVEETGLHPLSCLTTISPHEREQLFSRGIVLCKSVLDEAVLHEIGIDKNKITRIRNEAEKLCAVSG